MSEVGFKYSILASGSTGNCFYLETPKRRLLIDAGLTGKKITSLLAEIDRKPEDLDAILITHEHSDHIKGVGIMARKYNLDVYANEKTWQMIDERHMIGNLDVAQKHVFERGKDRKSTRLNSSHANISYAVFCLKKKTAAVVTPRCANLHTIYGSFWPLPKQITSNWSVMISTQPPSMTWLDRKSPRLTSNDANPF